MGNGVLFYDGEFVVVMYGDEVFNEVIVVGYFGVYLGDYVFGFFDGGEIFDFVGYFVVDYFVVGGFQEVVFVGVCIVGQGVDQVDVWIFWCFDWIYLVIVSWVNVLYFEVGMFMGQVVRV